MGVINPNDYPQGLMFSDEIQKQISAFLEYS